MEKSADALGLTSAIDLKDEPPSPFSVLDESLGSDLDPHFGKMESFGQTSNIDLKSEDPDIRHFTPSIKREACPSTSHNPKKSSRVTILVCDDKNPRGSVSATSSTNISIVPARAKKRCKRSLTNVQIEAIVRNLENYGSEDSDSDKDVDEDLKNQLACSVIPRADRVYMYAAAEEEREHVIEVSEIPSTLSVYRPPPPIETKFLPPAPLTLPPQSSPLPKIEIFEWTKFPDPPEERRGIFLNTDCGSTASFPTPYDAFVAIWDRQIMENIAEETNKYTQQLAKWKIAEGTLGPSSRIKDWTDTNPDELYVYFAIILGTGIVVKSHSREYWSKDIDLFESPGFNKYMSRNRYELLNRCLHFSDYTANLIHLSRPEGKVFKIAPIVEHLNQKFQVLYKLDRNIVIDESLTQWKGWLNMKHFIKNNATSAGVRTFELSESQTGYLWRFEVCTDIETPPTEASRLSGFIPKLVLRLLNGLEHRGHTVWMDKNYNSLALARELKRQGFDCVGPLKLNHQDVPQELAYLKKEHMEVGSVYGCTSGDVDVMAFRDQNVMGLISTYHGISVNTKDDKIKPTALNDYNVCMGGLDKKDQLLAMNPIERKHTKIWYKKFFRRLLNVSVVNAFILHKKSPISDNPIVVNHREFRKQLATQLLAKHAIRRLVATKALGSKSRGSVIFPEAVMEHFPMEYGFRKGNRGEKIRKSCVQCHKRTQTYCPECNVALCAFTCHKLYHAPDSP